MDRSKIHNILILDPAASTGFAVGRVDGDTMDIYDYGFIDIDVETDFVGDRCIDLMHQVGALIQCHNIDYVALEDFFFSSRTPQGSDVNAAYRTAIHILCRQNDIEYTILNISAWKKLVAGRSTSTKEQKRIWGKEPSKKLMIQEALWKNYGFRFPNHSISEKTGKPIKFRYDIVDAVAMAVYFARQYLDIQRVELSVTVPKDVEFKRKPKTLFNYSE
jgi:Holliday junction resolvasome RuvABC endonuclease subunit